ncbi:MAG: tryptophan synthase subunit alpha [Actinomycetota bacterium]|nr:tryptophan synthase subunit alpha [Actinomycetota bacterium]
MSRIEEVFCELNKANKKALIPFVVGGYPSLEVSERLIGGLSENGADMIEIGIPYSDPLADGPTIQRAYEVALKNGVDTDDILAMAGRLTKKITTPLIIMTYYNIIYRYGEERFATAAKEIGIAGVIIPDLPVEEAADWKKIAEANYLDTIFLVAPTSPGDRISLIAEASKGFIYCLSLTGVTGARSEVSKDLAAFLTRIRTKTEKPLAVGFGISSPEAAKNAAKLSDGVIVGSALIDLIDHSGIEYDKIYEFIQAMKAAIGG